MIHSLHTALVLVCTLLSIISSGSPAPSNADRALAGTAWQLVKIVSMNDRMDAPDGRFLYTIEFKKDGSSTRKSTLTSITCGAPCAPRVLLPKTMAYPVSGDFRFFMATPAG
jgi:hypothetical protein